MLSEHHVNLLEARGFDAELLENLGIESVSDGGGEWIAIPFVEGGVQVNAKRRTIAGEKRFYQDAGARQTLWNVDVVSDATLAHLPLIITEGELDAIAALQAGFGRVVSVPNGAPATAAGEDASERYRFLDNAPRQLGDCREIILAVDSDGPGVNLLNDLALRLGRARCKWLKYPKGCKDLADALRAFGTRGVVESVNRAQWMEVDGLYRMSELPPLPEVIPHDSGFPGLRDHFKLRPGDLSVVTGCPSHGKTTVVNDIACRMASRHKWPVVFASFEQVTQRDHRRWLRTWYCGQPVMSQTSAETAAADQWIDKNFAFTVPGVDDDTTLEWVVERLSTAVIRYGARLAVIDPWNQIEHDHRAYGLTLTEYVCEALKRLKRFAEKYQVHLFVVVHPAKMRRGDNGKYPIPSLYDISDCYSDDTEVLTERGWLPHYEISLADRVACFDLPTGQLQWHCPREVVHYRHDGQMAHFSGPSMDMLVTPNHRMVLRPYWGNETGRVGRWGDGEWQFCAARDIPRGRFQFPLTAVAPDGDEPDTVGLDGGYPIVPFLKFLGWWLAEGWVASNSISICQQPGELQEQMRSTLVDDLSLDVKEATDDYPNRPHCAPTWRAYVRKRHSPEIVEWMIENCGAGAANKRLPEIVWTLSPRLKRIVLEAFIDGDGFRPANRAGSAAAVTTSPHLRDGLQRLAVECGIPCCVGVKRQVKAHHAPSWQLTFGRSNRTALTMQVDRHLAWIPYSGDVWCLRVPTGAYVTRRNGRVAFQGNSAHWYNKCDVGMIVYRDEDDTIIRVAKTRYHDQIGEPGEFKVRYVPERATFELAS